MKWPPLLALLAALLLILPLAWALRWVPGASGLQPPTHFDSRLVPRFSAEEHGHLRTLFSHCSGDEDCEAPLVCLRGLLLVRPFCTASECLTDLDCKDGFSCHPLAVGERVVRLCAVNGEVEEGGSCQKIPSRPSMGCKPELICAAGLCARPCSSQPSLSCPPGFFCSSEDEEGPVCLPTCEGRACPQEQQCVHLEQGASVCARVHGTECQRTPCPAEQKCEVSAPAKRPGEVWMRCARSCANQEPLCPHGWTCVAQVCRRACEQGEPGTCGPGEACKRMEPAQPGLCAFDF
jgi:hypothetical protein